MRINKDDYVEYNGFTFVEAKVNKISHSIERYPDTGKTMQCRNCMLDILLCFIEEMLESPFVKEIFKSAKQEFQKKNRDILLFEKMEKELDVRISAEKGWYRWDDVHLLRACAVYEFIFVQRRFKDHEVLSKVFMEFMERICRLIDKSEEDQLLTIIKKYFP